MSDNVIWSVDFRARREREAAELETASAVIDGGTACEGEGLGLRVLRAWLKPATTPADYCAPEKDPA